MIRVLTRLPLKGLKSSSSLAIVENREQREKLCLAKDWKSELFVIVNSGGLQEVLYSMRGWVG